MQASAIWRHDGPDLLCQRVRKGLAPIEGRPSQYSGGCIHTREFEGIDCGEASSSAIVPQGEPCVHGAHAGSRVTVEAAERVGILRLSREATCVPSLSVSRNQWLSGSLCNPNNLGTTSALRTHSEGNAECSTGAGARNYAKFRVKPSFLNRDESDHVSTKLRQTCGMAEL